MIYSLFIIIIIIIVSSISIGKLFYKKTQNVIKKSENEKSRFKSYYETTNQWLAVKNTGKRLETYFIDKGIRSLAIYGTGEMGMRLFEELLNSEISINYFIDRNAQYVEKAFNGIPLFTIDRALKETPVDAVVITPVADYGAIRKDLINAGFEADRIISLKDIVFDV